MPTVNRIIGCHTSTGQAASIDKVTPFVARLAYAER